MARFMLILLAEFALLEKENIIERTISGQYRAWEVGGKKNGRSTGNIEDKNRVLHK